MTRAHKLLFFILFLICVGMAVFLIRLRNRAQDRFQSEALAPPLTLAEDTGAAPTTVTLYMPNDLKDSLAAITEPIALPAGESAQARVLLDNLFAVFGASGSTHPMKVEDPIDDVFFLPLPPAPGQSASPGQLAVVNLSGAVTAAQPSGIEPENLTLLAIMATLHANIPTIAEVRFLVDGHTQPTLAGHADLTRTYLASQANPVPTPGQETTQP